MIIGNLTAGRFEFVTLTETTEQALSNLQKAWKNHAKLTGATWTWEDVEDAVILVPISLNDTLEF